MRTSARPTPHKAKTGKKNPRTASRTARRNLKKRKKLKRRKRQRRRKKPRRIPPPKRHRPSRRQPHLPRPRKNPANPPSPVPRKNKALRTARIIERLAASYPEARCALDFSNPLQLLVATILSAQSTDRIVNTVTPALFRKYKTAEQFAASDTAELEKLIHSSGFFRN